MKIEDFDTFRESVRGLYMPRLLTDANDFLAGGSFYQSGGLIVCRYHFSPMHFDHNPSQLREFDNDFILVERYYAGRGQGVVGDFDTQIDSDVLRLVDWSQRKRSVTTSVEGISVMIPHAEIDYDPSRHESLLSLDIGSVAGDLLSSMMERFFDAAQTNQTNEARLCRELIAHLVRQLLVEPHENAASSTEPFGEGFLIGDYIKRNLGDPSLGPEKICHDLNMSRATLYRHFANEGGVVRYIGNLRLALCFDDLQNTIPRRGEVKRVAEAWGFFDASAFNRKFRRRFHISPSDCLGLRHEKADSRTNHNDNLPVNGWLRRSLTGSNSHHP